MCERFCAAINQAVIEILSAKIRVHWQILLCSVELLHISSYRLYSSHFAVFFCRVEGKKYCHKGDQPF